MPSFLSKMMLFVYLELLLTLIFVFQGIEGDIDFKECGQKRKNIQASSLWPWMVAIMTSNPIGDYNLTATGFLIDHRHVLTSAGNVFISNISRYQVRISSMDYTRGEKYGIVRLLRHPDYRPSYFYDNIAILTLDRPVTDPDFNPVCLPKKDVRNMNLDKMKATIVGWGRNEQDHSIHTLQQLKGMPLVSNEDCQRILREEISSFPRQFPDGINNKLMCAGFPEGGKDACGAGGSPLMIERNGTWYVVGILSFGKRCGLPGIPAGFTRVSAYSEWICEKSWS